MSKIKSVLKSIKNLKKTKLNKGIKSEDKIPQDFSNELKEFYKLANGGFIEKFEGENYYIFKVEEISKNGFDYPFRDKELIPFIDCKDGNFICYNKKSDNFIFINIYDEIEFQSFKNIEEMLETIFK